MRNFVEVESFHQLQNLWLHAYEIPIQEEHYYRAAKVPRLSNLEKGKVLELGAGGGQVAAALASMGFEVSALDLLPMMCQLAERLVSRVSPPGSLNVIQGDFYSVNLPGKYDLVCYWDGFGIGHDDDQRRLLTRISNWLVPGGCALVDVALPWFPAKMDGRVVNVTDDVFRRIELDPVSCGLMDTWWHKSDPERTISTEYRCYTPADLRLLLEGSGLTLKGWESNGAVDYDNRRFLPDAPLVDCVSYVAVLRNEC